MSEETPTKSGTKKSAQTQPAPDPDADTSDTENREFAARVRRYLDYAVLAGLLLLALIAALQFYLNASQTISTWVNPEYRAPFQAAFNLVLLLAAALGISIQLRRLTKE
ncbi:MULTISPECIES: hypothetical protein [Haloferax]|uniref:DUF8060 domain-containing protein n=1 Tax=Haloferax marinum TaxID=2666143 RepID=A0A6A8G8T9_9EURY|nr:MULTISPECIES: hypothetical protein [Haloferax]KAB1198561.1 hypothetical protein Hfx1150_13970 [Haloferax sp. CBA1150]MRW97670.1 hypothetical protein [Haloferax marinum]